MLETVLWFQIDFKENLLVKYVITEVINNSEHMVLSDTMDGSVTEEIFVEDKSGQLWIKEKPDTEGYFTLRSKEAKEAKNELYLTPNTETNIFETKGM